MPSPTAPGHTPNDDAGTDDSAFLAAFDAGRLSAAQFDHRGHLRLACLLLQREPLPQAVARACAGIAQIAARLGAPDKFHATLTEALLRWMAARGAAGTPSWTDFLARHPQLVHDARGLIARHYSAARLASAQARRAYVEPDLRPLDTDPPSDSPATPPPR